MGARVRGVGALCRVVGAAGSTDAPSPAYAAVGSAADLLLSDGAEEGGSLVGVVGSGVNFESAMDAFLTSFI